MKNEIKLCLWDLPENEVYLKIKKRGREAFFKHAVKLTGDRNKLDRFLKLSNTHRRQYETGKYFCLLRIIQKILSICPEKKKQKLMLLVERNVEEIRKGYGGKVKSIKNPKLPIKFSLTLPIKFSLTLCRIIGHIIGDGGIKHNYAVQYTNKSKIITK